MKRALRLTMLVAVLAFGIFAQEEKGGAAEGAHEKGAATETEGEGGDPLWKWANFLVLAVGIGYFAGKYLPGFFTNRTQQINKDMAEAEAERKAAEERAAAVEQRLANLESEIASLRTDAKRDSESETKRMAEHTADQIAKIQAHAEQEIVAAGKAARMELKRHAAELAVGLAEQKIRARMTPETQDSLVRGFVRDLQ